MLIWTTTGPKRAEKSVTKQPSEEAFAESHAERDPSADSDKAGKAETCADVFLDRPATDRAPTPEAADDSDWSSAETPRTRAPETAE